MHREEEPLLVPQGSTKWGQQWTQREERDGIYVLHRVGGGRKGPSREGQPHAPVPEQRQLSQGAGRLPSLPPHATARISTSSTAPLSPAKATEWQDNHAGCPG